MQFCLSWCFDFDGFIYLDLYCMPGGQHPNTVLNSAFVTWRMYGIVRILQRAQVLNPSIQAHKFLVAHVSRPYIRTGALCLVSRILVFSLMKIIWPVKNWIMSCWCNYLSGAKCKWLAYGPADVTPASVKSRVIYTYSTGLSLPSVLLPSVLWCCWVSGRASGM